ncbi:MAG: hypothetical protein KC917_20915, partial [Candidatus Omnitrophica bacterium]|nr:hypothetical protein [Candidatus Omnitrophota bacterium]
PSQIHSSIVERYCRALMQLGLFRLAAQELERFIGVTEKSRLRGLLGDLEHVVDAMDRDATVFLPERGVDPKQILLAASRLGIPFTARIAKKALTRISVDEVSASLHPLLDRLRRNPTLSNHQSTILHDPMPMTWINAGGQMESNDGVVIESSDPSMPGLEILVTFRDIQMQKFIEPWIVFRPSPSEKGVGLDACNKQSLDWLRQLESSEGRDVWLKKVDEILRTEIRTWEGVTRTVKRREQQLERITK